MKHAETSMGQLLGLPWLPGCRLHRCKVTGLQIWRAFWLLARAALRLESLSMPPDADDVKHAGLLLSLTSLHAADGVVIVHQIGAGPARRGPQRCLRQPVP